MPVFAGGSEGWAVLQWCCRWSAAAAAGHSCGCCLEMMEVVRRGRWVCEVGVLGSFGRFCLVSIEGGRLLCFLLFVGADFVR